MSRFILSAIAALFTTSAAPVPVADQCDELSVPFVVPGSVATDAELVDWINAESATYCPAEGKGTAWCACFAAGLIRD